MRDFENWLADTTRYLTGEVDTLEEDDTPWGEAEGTQGGGNTPRCPECNGRGSVCRHHMNANGVRSTRYTACPACRPHTHGNVGGPHSHAIQGGIGFNCPTCQDRGIVDAAGGSEGACMPCPDCHQSMTHTPPKMEYKVGEDTTFRSHQHPEFEIDWTEVMEAASQVHAELQKLKQAQLNALYQQPKPKDMTATEMAHLQEKVRRDLRKQWEAPEPKPMTATEILERQREAFNIQCAECPTCGHRYLGMNLMNHLLEDCPHCGTSVAKFIIV